MSGSRREKLSTSALAKSLAIPVPQLFTTLRDYGWIKNAGDGWILTGKGEFEGGEYVHSKRYGRYIVWPDTLLEHPLLNALEANKTLSATAIGKTFQLSARQVNRVLAEIGWIVHGPQGWEITRRGQQHGGFQLENENSGTFYVAWPEQVLESHLLNERLTLNQQIFRVDGAVDEDMFAGQDSFRAPDGHVHDNRALLQICHWLYSNGIAHACHHPIPDERADTPLMADFYLPRYQLYIQYWPPAKGSAQLSAQLARKDIAERLELLVLEVEEEDLPHLDEVLTRFLRQQGVKVY